MRLYEKWSHKALQHQICRVLQDTLSLIYQHGLAAVWACDYV